MITIKDTHFTSDIPLSNILMVKTKEYMLQLCNKLDLYVSPNLKKEETAGRVATELLDNPLHILQGLSKLELRLVDEFVKAGPNAYVHYKMRKNMLKLQKFCLVLTYEDKEKGEWMMLMPDCMRESLSESYHFYLDMAEKGVKAPSVNELRMLSFLNSLENGK